MGFVRSVNIISSNSILRHHNISILMMILTSIGPWDCDMGKIMRYFEMTCRDDDVNDQFK